MLPQFSPLFFTYHIHVHKIYGVLRPLTNARASQPISLSLQRSPNRSVFKSKPPNLELVILRISRRVRNNDTAHSTTDTRLFEILTIEIPDKGFNVYPPPSYGLSFALKINECRQADSIVAKDFIIVQNSTRLHNKTLACKVNPASKIMRHVEHQHCRFQC